MLLRNDNKRFIRTLSDNCLKANKIRNVIALLAIILTAVLFTAVATVFQGAQVSIFEQRIRQSGTRFMASVKFTTAEETEEIMADPAWETVGVERPLWNAANPELANMNVSLAWMDENYAEYSYMEIEEGHMPQEQYDIACDTEVLRLLGVPAELGSRITIQYITDEGVQETDFTLCGIWRGQKYEQTAEMMVSEAFLEERIDESTITHDASVAGSYCIRGSFDSSRNVEAQLDEVLRNAGFDPEAERGEEEFVVHHVNPAYESQGGVSGGLILAAVAGVLLILAAGYLIIYNIFRISILKDIRLYGQLKTIGTSPGQIRYMVKRQGRLLAAAGIPAGLILGWLLGNALLPLVMTSMTTNQAVFVRPNLIVWIVSAVFTFFTVWISCSRPGRIAGRVSPVEALRYQEGDGMKLTVKKGRNSRHRIFRMAWENIMRSRGRTVLVVLSISLSLILLNSVLNATGCFDQETYVRRKAVTDFTVHSSNYDNANVADTTKTLNPGLIQQIEELEGAVDIGKSYIHILPEDEVTEADGGALSSVSITERNGARVNIVTDGSEEEKAEAVEEFDWRRMLYGWDENMMRNMTLIEGNLDYEKLDSGNYVIMAGFLSDDGEYLEEAQEFHAGDKIRVEILGDEKEYEVLAVAGVPSTLNMDGSEGGYEAVVLSEGQFHEFFPEETDPIICTFNAEEGMFDAVNTEVQEMASQMSGSVITKQSAEQEFDEMQGTYRMAGVVLAGIFAVIGILNLTNVILTGAIARQNEFAVMRSIGMSRRQLRRLFLYEGILYAVISGAAGVLLSAVLSLTAVKVVVSGWWFAKYTLTILPASLAALVCIPAAAVIAWIIDRVWNKGSIVEKLRRIE